MTSRDSWNAVRARRWLRKCAAVGEGLRLDGRPTVEYYGGRIRIGSRLHLASRPVASHLAVGPGALLDIGNDVSIGCGAAIAAFQHVQIGDGTRVGPFVIIMDTSFHGSPGDQSLQHNCRPVMIGAGCLIGTRVTITRGATIGDGAEILAGSVVSSAIPPGVCAAGARARIIGRAGDPASRWDSAAAVLPNMLMASLGLDSPPDLDSGPIPPHLWTNAGIGAVLGAVHNRFGVELDPAAVREIRSFADIAAAIQRVLWEH
ncbi:MAG TPA: acyltransferase [Steroidobacteraceae bacterium]|jgi:acetyltransferase-like isoleucine patch superfamily enzyme|nr:acyltransferase [Steroidobacteraceae bacterium]